MVSTTCELGHIVLKIHISAIIVELSSNFWESTESFTLTRIFVCFTNISSYTEQTFSKFKLTRIAVLSSVN